MRICKKRGRLFTARVASVIAVALCLVLTCGLGFATAQKSSILTEGIEFYKTGDYKQAVASFSDEIRKNPKSADAYNLRGLAYDAMGKYVQAERDFSEALKIAPKFADAYNNRGELYRRLGKNREALSDYMAAIRNEKTFADPHYNMGLVYEALGNAKKAAGSFKDYLKLNPKAKDKSKITRKIAGLEHKPSKKPPAGRVSRVGELGSRPSKRIAQHKTLPPRGFQPPKGFVPKDLPVEIPLTPQQIQQIQSVLLGLGMLAPIIGAAFWLITGLMVFLIAKKTRTPAAWLGFIPVLQIFLMLSIARKPMWWFILFLLPAAMAAVPLLAPLDPTGGMLPLALSAVVLLIPAIAWLLVCVGMAKMRGKSPFWGVLLWLPCTSIFGLLYLGLSR